VGLIAGLDTEATEKSFAKFRVVINIRCRAGLHITTLLVIQFYPASCNFLHVRYKQRCSCQDYKCTKSGRANKTRLHINPLQPKSKSLCNCQPVCLGVESPSATHDQIISCKSHCYSVSRHVASSLTRRRVWHVSWSLSSPYIFTHYCVQVTQLNIYNFL
jgi:hypothetical protein